VGVDVELIVGTSIWEQELLGPAGSGDLVRVEELLQGGADVNMQSENGTTALILSAAGGHLEVFFELYVRMPSTASSYNTQVVQCIALYHMGPCGVLHYTIWGHLLSLTTILRSAGASWMPGRIYATRIRMGKPQSRPQRMVATRLLWNICWKFVEIMMAHGHGGGRG